MEFVIEHGMLQAKDVNPAAAGESTPELTNPRTEAAEDIKQEIVTGKHAFTISPLVYILALAVLLFVWNLFQQ